MILMVDVSISEDKGVSGLLKVYRDLVRKLLPQPGATIAFFGCPGVCTPFVELLAYTLRKEGYEMLYIPNTSVDRSRALVLKEEVGMQVGDFTAMKPADLAVVSGGLAMPVSCLTADDARKVVKEVLKPEGVTLGFCFLDYFKKAGWEENPPFQYVLNLREDSKVEVKTFLD